MLLLVALFETCMAMTTVGWIFVLFLVVKWQKLGSERVMQATCAVMHGSCTHGACELVQH